MSTLAKMRSSEERFWMNGTVYEIKAWDFEDSLDMQSWIKWMDSSAIVSIYIVGFYLAAIYIGQGLMRNRPSFGLKDTLCLWNLGLAVFSFLGALRTVPALMHSLNQENGIYSSICARYQHDTVTTFWSLAFTLSKVAELGDTAFIVLKKKPLIFLHWFHHATVLTYTWVTFPAFNSNGTLFMAMNFLIHTIMYTYYVFKLRGFRVPKIVSIFVTFLQILQMAIGISVNMYSLRMKSSGSDCFVKTSHIYACLGMYASYFVLFGNYFKKAYLVPVSRDKRVD